MVCFLQVLWFKAQYEFLIPRCVPQISPIASSLFHRPILLSTEHKLCSLHVAISKLLSLNLSQVPIFFLEFCWSIRTQPENYKECVQYTHINMCVCIHIYTYPYTHTYTYTQQETAFNRLSVYVCYSGRRVGVWQMVPSSDGLQISMLPPIKEFH